MQSNWSQPKETESSYVATTINMSRHSLSSQLVSPQSSNLQSACPKLESVARRPDEEKTEFMTIKSHHTRRKRERMGVGDLILKEGKSCPKPKHVVRKLRKMLSDQRAYGLPGTNGTLLANCLENLREEHPIASLFFIHPIHPFSKSNRAIFIWNTLAWLLFVAAVFEMTLNDGTNPVLKSFLISLLTLPYNTFCKQLLHCWCCVGCKCLEMAGSCLGRGVVFLLTICSLVFLVLGIMWSVKAGPAFAGTFFVSLAFGWILGALYRCASVGWRMKKDKLKFEKEWEDIFDEVPPSISLIALFVRNNTELDVILSTVEECKSIHDWDDYFRLNLDRNERNAVIMVTAKVHPIR